MNYIANIAEEDLEEGMRVIVTRTELSAFQSSLPSADLVLDSDIVLVPILDCIILSITQLKIDVVEV